MTEIRLGDKYECFNCGVKFYDLGKGAPVCPKCGADQQEAEGKENPLMAQSVKRKRKAELLPETDEVEAAPLDEEELDEEELELDEEELEGVEAVEAVEEVEEKAHGA